MGQTVRGSFVETWMGKSTDLGTSTFSPKNMDYAYRVTWNGMKTAGRKQIMAPMWQKLMKLVGASRTNIIS